MVIGILAHVDAGKTTLIEALLFRTGAVRKLGRVDAGDSHLDFNEIEQSRGITVYAKQAVVDVGDVELTFIDTPGHVDFSSEAERTLQVLDYAVLVIDADDGVRGHTETLWRLLQRRGIPTFVFANKMDLSHRSCSEVMEELGACLSDACLDFTGFETTAQLDGTFKGGISPELSEACACTEEAALDEFFNEGLISTSTLQRLVRSRLVIPCFFGSALKLDGVDDFLCSLACLAAEPQRPRAFGARVFKVSHDQAGARLTWMKVTGGVLEVKQPIDYPGQMGATTEKVDQIRRYSGGKYTTTPVCEAGEVCAVTGLSQTFTGLVLGRESENDTDDTISDPCTFNPTLMPAFASSVILNGCDVRAVHSALNQLTDEDPLLEAQWNERLQELQVKVMGSIQLEVIQATLKDRFGLDVGFGPSGVLYRETIEAPVTGIGHFEPLRHYAEVHLLIEPLSAGSGVKFGTRCHVDELDLNWQRLILTNAMEREHAGVLIGAPLTDVRITLVGGRAHEKHTEGGDFRQATYRAIRQGLMQAQGVLLEPWNRFALRVPTNLIGRAISDLQLMCARYEAPLTEGDFTTVEGIAPAAEIAGYAVQLGSYAHGMGSLSLEFHGYEPCHNAQEVIEAAAYDPEADLANTPDSVFCSHGAGHTVKWNDVPEAAHVKPDPSTFTTWREATPEFFGK